MVAYLIGRTIRTHTFKPTAMTSTIRTTTELLLEDVNSDGNLSLQRKWYQESLCDAVVGTTYFRELRRLIKEHPGLSADELETSSHMLAAAAAVGNMIQVRDLLSTNTGTSIRSDFFGCALTNSAGIGREDIVALLLESFDRAKKAGHQPDPNTRAASALVTQQEPIATALIAACELGYETIVQMLSRHTCQFQQISDSAITDSVEAAAYNGHIEIVQWFLEIISFSDKDKALSQLMLASCRGGHINLVKTLLHAGADINACADDGHSCLCVAAERGHFAVAKLLLMIGGVDSVTWRDVRGDALCIAAKHGSEDIVQLILDSDISYGGRTNLDFALVQAANHGETRMV